MPRTNALHAISIACLLPLAACAGAGQDTPELVPPRPTGAEVVTGTERLSDDEIEAIYRDRVEAGRTRFTEADVRFMQDMIHHHAQAVEISRFVPERAESDQLRTLAARIINAQQDEIALMQRWLRDRGQPVPEIHELCVT